MNKSDILNKINQHKLVVIIRVESPELINNIVECMIEAGVAVLEITSNTPGYAEKITELRAKYPELIIGAGTIIDGQIALQAIEAGAQFLVTPNTSKEVASIANQHELPVLMGAFTPTDVVEAKKAGADIVKLFPAEPIGCKYLASLAKGPFLDIPFFPVGGIDEYNFIEWMQSGAKGIGIGGSLAKPVFSNQDKQELIKRVSKIVNTLKVL
ncbi:bifunctional 4-hydroxy-2-oxoglutarate aldolase/2-dehydro-3-deoxy-phosphogluconate aldolase [Catenovulum sediminis]|uniref:Bifunctional 4-hydroxy-2-oxoglutarate aldolase/2-dehydro-3-deoxy-phosphogluconate aldolase n=1 Tax=Catenovulum sediminis TaxID=1740262 RepID=A0ABV1RIG8_9ALTE|nr:bifunctional 4-hydroxy-2-oxoglutarate aldolase/2-dehydro-3-deoxy-phosphogluconate aldolase [Catenovulum sediminis]